MRTPTLAVAATLLSGCFLFQNNNNKDPLAKANIRVQTYSTNTSTSTPEQLTGSTGESWSNRPVGYTATDTGSEVTKFTVRKVFGNTDQTCELKDEDGKPMTTRNLDDWAGVDTQYSFTLETASSSKSFGPFAITVHPANVVLKSATNLTDQNNDGLVGAGSFFQTKSFEIGFGGYTGPNFNSLLVAQHPRMINFAFFTLNSVPTVLSPDLILANSSFPRLVNDCGFLTTTFATYTGTVDPENANTTMTIAEVRALPDPAPGATTLALSNGLKFVYKTSEGMKGLVKVKTVTLANGSNTAELFFIAEQ